MTNQFTDYGLGYVMDVRSQQTVEFNAVIAKGQGLNIESVNSDGQAIVGVATVGEKAQYVALFAGIVGSLRRVLTSGIVKITYGGVVAAGAAVKAGLVGKFVAAVRTVTVPTGGAGTGDGGALTVEGGIACGTNLTASAADNDTGLIDFMGGVIP